MEGVGGAGHYGRLARDFDRYWAYSPAFVAWMAGRITHALSLSPGDRIADIGAGTGLYAREVARAVRPAHPVVCADPSPAMLARLNSPSPYLAPLLASAEDVAEGRVDLPCERFDAVWLKEVVHHLADPARTLAGLSALLAPGGRLLVVMRPATLAYPLFPAALARFQESQPDPAEIAHHLRSAGLTTTLTYAEHELRIGLDRHCTMVRARYMSLLSTFSDGELEEGIQQIRAAHPGPELVFPDRFAFICARRC
ncbi:hypothetical protein GCM10010394_55640 [Streptomyces crystallinus]|uniref:Methyltransferase type 11 domain-containing protein n=1 Tax=Streptomyces crystallinus TaxID=68191 RepID=A0ABN1GSE3_9ACTN